MQDERLTYILSDILDAAPVEFASVYTRSRQENRYVPAATQKSPLCTVDCKRLERWLPLQLDTLTASDHVIRRYTPEHQLCLFYMLAMFDEVIGVVVVIPQTTDFDPARIMVEVRLIQTVLENIQLTERLIMTEAVALTAQAIAQNPSPQNIVDVLRDYLFDIHIVSCAIGFFGASQPGQPFDYIEIQGSWSRRLGSKIGVGKRFDIRKYANFIDELERRSLYSEPALSPNTIANLDEFLRIMLQVDQVRALTLLMLRSDTQKVGVLAIMVDHPYEFPEYELRSYQIVAEFLTMTTRAASFQQQIDFFQQGRVAMLSAVTDGVVMVLPDEGATILTANDRFGELFHLRQREILGLSLWAVLDKLDMPEDARVELYEQWQRRDGFRNGEFQITGSAHTRAFQWNTTPVYQADELLGYVYTFHDITPERAAEQLRSELVSRLSHELRTPLTSIRGFAEFILEADGDSLSPLTREYTEIIHKSAEHLNTMFTDLIEVTRANIGELKIRREVTSIIGIVLNVLERFQSGVEERGQKIKVHIDQDLPMVNIDRERIGQVLNNLVHNAMKFAPEGSTIYVSVQGVHSDDTLPEDFPNGIKLPCIMVSVIDEGPGVNEEEIEKIFLPFYRTALASRNKVEGGGLGLAIAHSIIDLHEGRMWAEPISGKHSGGRFFFALPAVE